MRITGATYSNTYIYITHKKYKVSPGLRHCEKNLKLHTSGYSYAQFALKLHLRYTSICSDCAFSTFYVLTQAFQLSLPGFAPLNSAKSSQKEQEIENSRLLPCRQFCTNHNVRLRILTNQGSRSRVVGGVKTLKLALPCSLLLKVQIWGNLIF